MCQSNALKISPYLLHVKLFCIRMCLHQITFFNLFLLFPEIFIVRQLFLKVRRLSFVEDFHTFYPCTGAYSDMGLEERPGYFLRDGKNIINIFANFTPSYQRPFAPPLDTPLSMHFVLSLYISSFWPISNAIFLGVHQGSTTSVQNHHILQHARLDFVQNKEILNLCTVLFFFW